MHGSGAARLGQHLLAGQEHASVCHWMPPKGLLSLLSLQGGVGHGLPSSELIAENAYRRGEERDEAHLQGIADPRLRVLEGKTFLE